jgi:hypothetical protein
MLFLWLRTAGGGRDWRLIAGDLPSCRRLRLLSILKKHLPHRSKTTPTWIIFAQQGGEAAPPPSGMWTGRKRRLAPAWHRSDAGSPPSAPRSKTQSGGFSQGRSVHSGCLAFFHLLPSPRLRLFHPNLYDSCDHHDDGVLRQPDPTPGESKSRAAGGSRQARAEHHSSQALQGTSALASTPILINRSPNSWSRGCHGGVGAGTDHENRHF